MARATPPPEAGGHTPPLLPPHASWQPTHKRNGEVKLLSSCLRSCPWQHLVSVQGQAARQSGPGSGGRLKTSPEEPKVQANGTTIKKRPG